jgi:hypothetical protein
MYPKGKSESNIPLMAIVIKQQQTGTKASSPDIQPMLQSPF